MPTLQTQQQEQHSSALCLWPQQHISLPSRWIYRQVKNWEKKTQKAAAGVFPLLCFPGATETDSKGSPCCCMQLAWLPLVRSAAEVWAQDGSSPHQCWHRCVLTVPGKHLPAQITTTAAIRAFALMFISIKTHCSSLCCTLMCSSSPLLPLPERLSATLSRLHHC